MQITFSNLVDEGVLAIGDGYRAKNDELGSGGPVFLRSAYLQDSGWSLAEPERFSEPGIDRFGPKVACVGDTAITTKGNSLGRLGFVRGAVVGAVYSPHLSYWRSLRHDLIEPRWLYYWALSSECMQQVQAMAYSTDMAPYLSLRDQLQMKIELPPLAEQRAIAAVLGTLDDKIEANRTMSASLEAMARALFKSWFVDFERSIERVTAETLRAQGVLEIGDGYRAKNDEMGEPGLPFIRAGNLQGDIDTHDAELLSAESVSKAGNKLSKAGDVAFTSKGTVGRFSFVTERTPQFVYSPQLCFWRSLDWQALAPSVLYTWMVTDEFQRQIDAVAAQTDMAPYVSLQDQRRMLVPRFPTAQHSLAGKLDALIARRSLNQSQSRTLAQLRDLLLPKLLSGALRIEDAEGLVEDAA